MHNLYFSKVIRFIWFKQGTVELTIYIWSHVRSFLAHFGLFWSFLAHVGLFLIIFPPFRPMFHHKFVILFLIIFVPFGPVFDHFWAIWGYYWSYKTKTVIQNCRLYHNPLVLSDNVQPSHSPRGMVVNHILSEQSPVIPTHTLDFGSWSKSIVIDICLFSTKSADLWIKIIISFWLEITIWFLINIPRNWPWIYVTPNTTVFCVCWI